jgi:hypothetical protein
MEESLVQEIVEAAYAEDRKQFNSFSKSCSAHFGRICVDNQNAGILCRYEYCPHRALKEKYTWNS